MFSATFIREVKAIVVVFALVWFAFNVLPYLIVPTVCIALGYYAYKYMVPRIFAPVLRTPSTSRSITKI